MSGEGGPNNLEQGGKRVNILAAFHHHPELELPGENQWSLEQVVNDNPDYIRYVLSEECSRFYGSSDVGQNTYETTSEIRLIRDETAIDDKNTLEAIVAHRGLLAGEYLLEKYIEVVNAHEVGYLSRLDTWRILEVAKIEIPPDFDQEKLETTVDAAVSLLSTLVDLQTDITSTIRSFKHSPYRP
jgi:hypothetical protein